MNRKDQDWVSEQIRVATQRPEIHGIKRVIRLLREWAILGPLIASTIAIALFIGNSITRDSEFRGSTDQRLKNIEQKSDGVGQRLKEIEDTIVGLRLQLSATHPAEPESIKQAQNILGAAKATKVAISTDIIADAGKRFIETAAKVPEAWTAAKAFLDYRSFLNASLVSSPPNPRPSESSDYHFALNVATQPPPEPHGPLFSVLLSGTASPGESALLDSLSSPPPPGTGSGAKFLIVDALIPGMGLSLDGMRMKNVVIRNAVIFYSGAPVILENVAFVNCTFQIARTPAGARLGGELLTRDSLSFKYPAA